MTDGLVTELRDDTWWCVVEGPWSPLLLVNMIKRIAGAAAPHVVTKLCSNLRCADTLEGASDRTLLHLSMLVEHAAEHVHRHCRRDWHLDVSHPQDCFEPQVYLTAPLALQLQHALQRSMGAAADCTASEPPLSEDALEEEARVAAEEWAAENSDELTRYEAMREAAFGRGHQVPVPVATTGGGL